MSQANSEVTFLCLNTIADYGSAADSESGLYQEVKMKLTPSKEDSPCYSLFVGTHSPAESMGSVGDIAVQTPFPQVVIEIATKKNAHIKPGDNHIAHTVYYKTQENWRSIDDDRVGGERRCPRRHRPYTTHPTLRLYVLEDYVFRWRRYTSYTDPKASTSKTERSSPTPSGKRTHALAGPTSSDENEGGKRLRTGIPPSPLPPTVNNSSSFSGLAHEGNRWILNEYTVWNTVPITNIHQTYERGRDILAKLLKFPDMITHGTAMKHVHLLPDAVDKHMDSEPELRDVIYDLMQGKKASISKVNFEFGSHASHISIFDVLASVCQAGDPGKFSGALLGALTIPESKGGLRRFSLTAGPFAKSANHVYEHYQKEDMEMPMWLSSLNPRGSITDPHIDYCGSQFVRHISGKKLWLFCPPTTHNLEVFCKKYKCRTILDFSMATAIKEFEKLELLLVEDGKSFVIPAGTIHGVITFTTSCHMGFKLWGFDDFVTARNLLNAYFELCKDPSKLDDTLFGHFDEIFTHMKNTEIDKWVELCQKNIRDECSQEILDWTERCKGKLNLKK